MLILCPQCKLLGRGGDETIWEGLGRTLELYLGLTHFSPMFPFDTPENTRKPIVFSCFQGVPNGNVGQERVNVDTI